jgi:prepilin-type N-terminal cleavage/methylation domain-containing protein
MDKLMARAMLETRSVNRRKARGFTLVEMMIVVVIVGVLSALAVAGYRMLITSSHVTEAQAMVNNIAVAQEEYHSETQTYANVSNSLTSYYPQSAPSGSTVTAWGAACGGQCTGLDWSVLPVHVDGPVYFGYATVAGPAGTNPPGGVVVNGQAVALPSPSPVDWFIVSAMCDLDGQGTPNTTVFRTSWQNTVMVSNEGQ